MITLIVITRAGIYRRTWTPDEIARVHFNPAAPFGTTQAALEALGYRVTSLQSCGAQVLAEVELTALPEDRLTFIMHDLAVRQQIELAIDYDELAALLEEVQRRRAAMREAADVVTAIPAAATAEDEAAIVASAVELAEDVCEADQETFTFSHTALCRIVVDRGLLAKAVAIMADRLDKLSTMPPTVARCHWCWLAAGDAPDAWAALPAMPFDEIRDHIMGCEHGPVVQLRRLKNRQIAELNTCIATLEQDVRDRDAKIKDLEARVHTLRNLA